MPPLKKQSRCTRSRADSVQPAPFLRSADGRSPNWRLIATDNVLALSLQPVVQNLSIWRGNTYDRAHHHLKKNARQFSFMGDRRRTGDIRGVLRLELRLVAGGHDGFMVVALAVAAMYCAFIFSFTELTTAIPHAGGPFAYAYRAFGPTGGFIAGFATLIEFVFAPPAIAMAIGAYLNVQFPALDPKWVACGAYVIFMTLNILGVGIAATFELIVTLLAIFELLVFMGVVAPGFSWSHFTTNGWAGAESFSGLALPGMFAAIPFAIWFFLAIEGASMAAEEAKDPQRTIPRAWAAAF